MKTLQALLDRTARSLEQGEPGSLVIDELCRELNAERRALSAGGWSEAARFCRAHRVCGMLHEDPYTRRAHEKPRGYAGDAPMLDFIYTGEATPQTSDLGRRVFEGTTTSSNARSVLERRDGVAALLDGIASREKDARVLAVACGHLREADVMQHRQRLNAFYAFDQDTESLADLTRRWSGTNVLPTHGSVKGLLRGECAFPPLACVYALGLYDYLLAPVAAQLTQRLFRLLDHGGQLLIGNFTPDNHGRGYMEAFMSWQLVYRDEADLVACQCEIPASEIRSQRAYRDSEGNIAYLLLERA